MTQSRRSNLGPIAEVLGDVVEFGDHLVVIVGKEVEGR